MNLRKTKIYGQQSGSVIFYIFLAVALLALLTYSVVQSSRSSGVTQSSQRIAETLFSQINAVSAAIRECAITYPGGGGDLDGDLDIDTDDNDNAPYPLTANDANNPGGAGADTDLRDIQCPGAPAAERFIYSGSGAGSVGRFLPPPQNGFGEWQYYNDTDGVRIETTGPLDQAVLDAVNSLETRFDACQADIDFGSCGSTCFTVWIVKATC